MSNKTPYKARILRKSFGEPKIFRHDPIIMPEMSDFMTDLGRFYKTPEGKSYPSMTTVLSILSKDAIDKWRKRVGEEEANKVMKYASERGTRVHLMAEKYIDNMVDDIDFSDYRDVRVFKAMKPILDQNVDDIMIQEVALYSDTLQIAGRTDVIGRYLGKLSVIDFKTSKKPKKEEWIHNYFMQVSGYAQMWNEYHGNSMENIHQGVVLISPDTGPPQEFVVDIHKWVPRLIETREKFRMLYDV